MDPLDRWALGAIAVQWLVYVSALLAAGGVWFIASQRTLPTIAHRFTLRVTVYAALTCVALTGFRLCVQAGRMIDDGWGGMIDPAMLALATQGSLGLSSWTRIAGLGLLLTAPASGRRPPWPALVGAVLVCASFATTGHATGEPRLALAALITVHVATASFWFGALWPLDRLAAGATTLADAAEASERFGRAAAWSVVVLAAAGVALGWLLVGSLGALFGTPYGWTLLAKIGLVGLLLGLAAANKWRLVPALGSADPRAAARAASGLRRSIWLEVVLFLAILLATAVLTNAATLPPR